MWPCLDLWRLLLDPAMLGTAFFMLERDVVPGVDGMTWRAYEANLDTRIKDLHARLQRDDEPWVWRTLRADFECFQTIATKRARSRSTLARPYICRFTSFSLVTWPSVRPFDHASFTMSVPPQTSPLRFAGGVQQGIVCPQKAIVCLGGHQRAAGSAMCGAPPAAQSQILHHSRGRYPRDGANKRWVKLFSSVRVGQAKSI